MSYLSGPNSCLTNVCYRDKFIEHGSEEGRGRLCGPSATRIGIAQGSSQDCTFLIAVTLSSLLGPPTWCQYKYPAVAQGS